MNSTIIKRTTSVACVGSWRWAAAGFAIVALSGMVLVLGFYGEENWRGKRAWEKCRRELGAGQGVLDWASYIPESAPDAQNIFKAADIAFLLEAGKGNDLANRLGVQNLAAFARERSPDALAEITILSPGEITNGAEPLLDYRTPLLTVCDRTDRRVAPDGEGTIIPLIVLEYAPLTDVIRNLAKQAGLEYSLDYEPRDRNSAQPVISMRWQEVTAMEALTEVLNNFDLECRQGHDGQAARIVSRRHEGMAVRVDALAWRALNRLLASRLAGETNSPETTVNGSQGLTLCTESRKEVPIRILVRAARIPGTGEVSDFFRPLGAGHEPFAAEVSGSKSFRLFRAAPARYAATDYLAWSDSFTNEFQAVREALTRPLARLEGNYEDPAHLPRVNLGVVRMLAQTLGQRAQCQLLLGKPELALGDMALLDEIPRLVQGKPMGLVGAMFTTALRGIYLDVVADGLRRHQWREQDLAVIQEQLAQVDLVSLMWKASFLERASACRTLEARDFKTILANKTIRFEPLSLSEQRKQDLKCWLAGFVPKGWTYLNMARVAQLEEEFMRGYDPATHGISRGRLEAAGQKLKKALEPSRPQNFLASYMAYDKNRAWRSAAGYQAIVDSARVACALERFRLAHGKYPESLASLSPEFIATLPRDLVNGEALHYRRKGDSHFIIYSVGWNERDDGGVRGKSLDWRANVDSAVGDWVWEG